MKKQCEKQCHIVKDDDEATKNYQLNMLPSVLLSFLASLSLSRQQLASLSFSPAAGSWTQQTDSSRV